MTYCFAQFKYIDRPVLANQEKKLRRWQGFGRDKNISITSIYSTMDFLKQKFFDHANLLHHLLTKKCELKPLEYDNSISEDLKREFRDNFFRGLTSNNTIKFKEETYNVVEEAINPWSIDFPSWIGEFDPEKGKKVFIIGSEPHIHYKYLQTVYGFHAGEGEKIKESSRRYFESGHPIFQFLPQFLSSFLKVSDQEVLEHCYLTDLVSFAPMKSKGVNVGSTNGINSMIKGTDDWRRIRKAYASIALENEIKGVKPEIIVTQGKEVFYEVCQTLLGSGFESNQFPINLKGRQQYIRIAKWMDIPILSVPHIGSKQLRSFWKSHLNEVKVAVNKHL